MYDVIMAAGEALNVPQINEWISQGGVALVLGIGCTMLWRKLTAREIMWDQKLAERDTKLYELIGRYEQNHKELQAAIKALADKIQSN